jgi:malate dehydrogenase (oxaloacetate-decarboxylating)
MAPLFPPLAGVRAVSRRVALEVGLAAAHESVAPATAPADLARRVEAEIWEPRYRRYRRRE